MSIVTAVNSTSPNTIKWASTDQDVYDRATQLAGLAENFDDHDHSSGKCLPVARLASSVTVNGGGTLTLPTSTDTLVGRATTDTLTNKTLTTPTINNPVLTLENNSTPTAAGRLGYNGNFLYYGDIAATHVVVDDRTAQTISGIKTFSTAIAVGGSPSASGDVRLSSGATVYANGGQFFLGQLTGATSMWKGTDFVLINQNAIATTATGGFIYIPAMAGTPTGIPGNAGAGTIPLVYDTSANKLWAYNNGWRGVAVA